MTSTGARGSAADRAIDRPRRAAREPQPAGLQDERHANTLLESGDHPVVVLGGSDSPDGLRAIAGRLRAQPGIVDDESRSVPGPFVVAPNTSVGERAAWMAHLTARERWRTLRQRWPSAGMRMGTLRRSAGYLPRRTQGARFASGFISSRSPTTSTECWCDAVPTTGVRSRSHRAGPTWWSWFVRAPSPAARGRSAVAARCPCVRRSPDTSLTACRQVDGHEPGRVPASARLMRLPSRSSRGVRSR